MPSNYEIINITFKFCCCLNTTIGKPIGSLECIFSHELTLFSTIGYIIQPFLKTLIKHNDNTNFNVPFTLFSEGDAIFSSFSVIWAMPLTAFLRSVEVSWLTADLKWSGNLSDNCWRLLFVASLKDSVSDAGTLLTTSVLNLPKSKKKYYLIIT